ncbi:hypothetical protein HanRHA438_Chr11g0483541 [Helianthus annuus]|nr:hypothetical protein HanHA300_Chr11g0385941 [Helianthus annuus]KAJ0507440.1 hypothetical protein HanIR_Chr11g0506261 [Helianthus annuus]KAJ0515941.1 hypothetical protein HanHA89_Chr11g0408351 [Helianthus annuus]KAJ0687907.1 hypothetical protein HanOQP8_Chr11g0388581 [Helianthus annuus]KAJ0868924.1 hypothetical protein HanRHA438_Chr11g0483541 [Helianthus annuus]
MNDTPFQFSLPSYTSDVQKFLCFYFSFLIYYRSFVYPLWLILSRFYYRSSYVCTDDESNSDSSRSESGTRPREVYLQSWRQDPPRPPDGRLKYTGGDTRGISVYHHVTFHSIFFRYSVLFLGLNPNVMQNLNIIVNLGFIFVCCSFCVISCLEMCN